MTIPTLTAQIAEEFAEQKVRASHAGGVDTELLRALWKANALEVLAFSVPRLGIPIEAFDSVEAPLRE